MATPSDAHLLAFGRIIHNFASVETGIKIVLSGLLDTRLADVLILCDPYNSISLKNVAKSLAKERLDPKIAERLCCIIGDWSAFGGLRNTIAHTRWTDGERVGSIKPRNVSIREGHARWIGDDSDEQSYAAADLEEAARKLHLINERLKDFLRDTGLKASISAKIAEESADKSPSSGSDTKNGSK